MNIGQGNYPMLSQKQANPLASSLQNVLQQHLSNMQMKSQTQGLNLQNQLAQKLMPSRVGQAQQDLQTSLLNNQKSQELMPYVIPTAQADLQGKQLGNTSQSLQNSLAKSLMPSQIEGAGIDNRLKSAQADYYENGGAQGGGDANIQNYRQFQSFISKDNPQLKNDPDLIYEAANVIQNGGDTLANGTKLNPLSPNSQNALAAIVKGTTTAPLATRAVTANQGEAEIQKLSEMSQQDIGKYGTTYAGYSPQQIIDALSSSPKSQTDLGNFIASQTAQFEIAQLRQKLAGATPTEGDTKQLMSSAQQAIKAEYPTLSKEAREQAAKRINEYFSEGLKARNKVGVNLSQLSGSYGDSSNNDYSSNSSSSAQSKVVSALMKLHGISQQEAEEIIGESNG